MTSGRADLEKWCLREAVASGGDGLGKWKLREVAIQGSHDSGE